MPPGHSDCVRTFAFVAQRNEGKQPQHLVVLRGRQEKIANAMNEHEERKRSGHDGGNVEDRLGRRAQ